MGNKHKKHELNLNRRSENLNLRQNESSNWYDSILVILMILTTFSLIFAYSIEYFAVFAALKLFLLRLFTFLMLSILAYKVYNEKKIILYSPVFYCGLLAYGLVSLINSIITINVFTSLYGDPGRFLGLFTMLNFLFVAFLTSQIFNTTKKQINFVNYFIGFGFLVAIYGILQYYQLIGDPSHWDQDPTKRVFGTFGHANHFGAFLGMNLSLALAMFFYTDKKEWKWFYGSTVVFSFWCLMATASRGALIATLFSVFIFGLILIRIKYKSFLINKNLNGLSNFIKFAYSNYKKTVFTIISGILALFILLIILLPKIENSYFVTRFKNIEVAYSNGFVPDRVSWWFSMVEMIKDKPLLGSGFDTFKDNYNMYRRLDYRNPDDLQDEVTPETGHMEYLSIAATQGLIGLATYMFPIIYIFYIAISYLRNKEFQKEDFVVLGLIGSLLVYLLQVLFNFGIVATWGIFFILLGLLATHINTQKLYKKEITVNQNFAIIILILMIIFSLYGMFWGKKQLDIEFWRRQSASASASKNYDIALADYAKIIELENGQNAFTFSDAGDYLYTISTIPELEKKKLEYLEKGLGYYEKAIDANANHPHFYSNLGLLAISLAQVYEKLGEVNKTSDFIKLSIKSYQEAIIKGPNNPLHMHNLMRIYIMVGQLDKAYQLANKVIELRGNYRDIFKIVIESAMLHKDFATAKKYAEQAIKMYPDNKDFKNAMDSLANSL